MRMKIRKIRGKIRIIDRNLRKNEESGTLAHLGLWGWLHPWSYIYLLFPMFEQHPLFLVQSRCFHPSLSIYDLTIFIPSCVDKTRFNNSHKIWLQNPNSSCNSDANFIKVNTKPKRWYHVVIERYNPRQYIDSKITRLCCHPGTSQFRIPSFISMFFFYLYFLRWLSTFDTII